MELGSEAVGRWLSHEGGVVMNGISTLIKETPESLLTPSAMCCSVARSCPALCDSMDCSTPGFLVVYCLPEPAQTHVHWVSDAIQPSRPLSSPFPPAFNLSQDQGLFKWVGSSHQVAKVLELQLQHQSFHCVFRVDFLEDWLVGSPCCPRDSQESSPTPQFESINSSTLSLLYGPPLTSVHDYWKNIGLTRWTFVGKVMFLLFKMLSRFITALLPKSKYPYLSTSWSWNIQLTEL